MDTAECLGKQQRPCYRESVGGTWERGEKLRLLWKQDGRGLTQVEASMEDWSFSRYQTAHIEYQGPKKMA